MTGGLRELAIRAGGYLLGREIVGMVVRLVGVVAVVRLIGPLSYGIYSGAAAFILFVATFAQLGLEVYLIRLGDEVEQRHYEQAASLLLVSSLIATAIAEALTFPLASVLRPVGVLLPLRVLLLSTPINVLWAPCQAAIEKRFDYRRMGIIEVGGDIVLYGTAIPLALAGYRAWSLVAGYIAWQTWLLATSLIASRLRFRWSWQFSEVRQFVRHGFGFSSAQWLLGLGGLLNPLVVGTFFGAVGVGYVAFAQRLVETVGFGKRSAYRLGMVAMSKVPSNDEQRLRYSVEEGTLLQLLALAVPFAAFGLVARWVVPFVFGREWSSTLALFSLLALATVIGAGGFVQSTFLYTRGKNLVVGRATLARVVVLAATSVVCVKYLGIEGFGVATLISLVGIVYADRAVRQMFSFSYAKVLPWLVVLGPVMLFPAVPLPWAFLLVLPLGLVALPSMRQEISRLSRLVRSALGVPTAGRRAGALQALSQIEMIWPDPSRVTRPRERVGFDTESTVLVPSPVTVDVICLEQQSVCRYRPLLVKEGAS